MCLNGILKPIGRLIRERRVQSTTVVVLFDELFNATVQLFEVVVANSLNFLTFQCFQKTPAWRVVVRVARRAHALKHLTVAKSIDVRSTCLLNALIGVVDDSWR